MRKGISIVALVITIIVLIILTATVIISMQDDNTLNKANKAVNRNNEATAQEKVIMEISNVKVPALELGQNVYEYFFDEENGYDRREELEKKGMHIQKGDQANTLDIEVNEYVVNVNSNGDVQEVFFSTEKRLPNEYQAVEYIQGTGVQYIITDYHPDKNGMMVEYKTNWQAAGMIVSSHNLSSLYGRNNGYLHQNMIWELGYGEICQLQKKQERLTKIT